jgi:5-methylcytosine-specific restriction endonuclease McrA
MKYLTIPSAIRSLIHERDQCKCQECGSNEHLMIHHKNGISNAPNDLILLCASCHKKGHSTDRASGAYPSRTTVIFENVELHKRVQRYTVAKMGDIKKQSEAMNKLLDIALKAKGY